MILGIPPFCKIKNNPICLHTPVCQKTITKTHENYAALGTPDTIWAIPAIHGDLERLTQIHDNILDHFQCGQKIIYLGNYSGYGPQSANCMNEILAFRRMILSVQGVRPSDLVYLRGNQEEMMHKLFQLPFAPNPTDCFLWMLGNGMSNTLQSYGLCPHDAIEACRHGVTPLTKWVAHLRATIRQNPGHDIFLNQLVRAAYTDISGQYPMLFVHAGLETDKPLPEQGDKLWWGSHDFEAMESPYRPFEKVIRGYDPAHKGLHLNCITATLDGGCGFGGSLICTGFDATGNVIQVFES